MGNLFVVFLWLTLTVAPVEKYYVTFVKGTVLLKKTGKPVKVGDALNPDDKLFFRDKTSKVSCISPGRGRFDISAQQVKADAGGELLAVLKSIMVPVASNYKLSTRSLMFEGYDPKTYFQSPETGGRILLIKGEALPFSPSYKQDDKNFFFVQFNLNGKPFTRKVMHNANGVIFTDELFNGISQASGTKKVMLCYQSVQHGTPRSSVVAEFVPVLASKAEIIEQVRLINQLSGITDKKKLNSETLAHLFDNYGKIGSGEVNKLMQ